MKHKTKIALTIILSIAVLTACSSTDKSASIDATSPTPNATTDVDDTEDARNVPTFPEDDIDWDSLRYRLDEQPTFDIEPIDGFEPYLPNHSLEQWQALDEDGKVTREDYETSFYRFQACVEENGARLNNVIMSGDRISASHSEYDRPIVDACYEYHFELVDVHWQVNLPPKDETYQINEYIDCFQEHGITPVHTEAITEAGEEQQAQLMELMDQAFEQAMECL